MPEERPSNPESPPSEAGSGLSGRGRHDHTRLWKALAGMAAALALAGAIVAMEISSHLVHRTHHYNHRIVELKKTIRELRHRAAMDRKHLLAVRQELSAREHIVRVLLASDGASIDFTPVVPEEQAHAALIVSRKTRGAVVAATGLPKLPSGHAYQAWWVSGVGGAAKASKGATFVPSSDGSATVYLTEPPRSMHARECVLTLGPSRSETPGRVILKAQLPR